MSGEPERHWGEGGGPARRRKQPPATSAITTSGARRRTGSHCPRELLRERRSSGLVLVTLDRLRGRSSVGRASASQAEGRGFDPRRPLQGKPRKRGFPVAG